MADTEDILIGDKPISSLRVVDLKAELERRGLSKSGTKKELTDRLKMHIMEEKNESDANSHSKSEGDDESNDIVKEYLAQQKEARQKALSRSSDANDEGDSLNETSASELSVEVEASSEARSPSKKSPRKHAEISAEVEVPVAEVTPVRRLRRGGVAAIIEKSTLDVPTEEGISSPARRGRPPRSAKLSPIVAKETLTVIEPEVPAVNSEVPAVKSDVPEVESEVPAVNSEVTAVKSDVPVVESEVPAIDPEVATVIPESASPVEIKSTPDSAHPEHEPTTEVEEELVVQEEVVRVATPVVSDDTEAAVATEHVEVAEETPITKKDDLRQSLSPSSSYESSSRSPITTGIEPEPVVKALVERSRSRSKSVSSSASSKSESRDSSSSSSSGSSRSSSTHSSEDEDAKEGSTAAPVESQMDDDDVSSSKRRRVSAWIPVDEEDDKMEMGAGEKEADLTAAISTMEERPATTEDIAIKTQTAEGRVTVVSPTEKEEDMVVDVPVEPEIKVEPIIVGTVRKLGNRRLKQQISQNEDTPAVDTVQRKRKWGGTGLDRKTTVSISTDVLKDIIPNVKPLPMSDKNDDLWKNDRALDLPNGDDKPQREFKSNGTIVRTVVQTDADDEDGAPVSTGRTIIIESECEPIAKKQRADAVPRSTTPSNILFIRNLVRPFTLNQLKELLNRTGKLVAEGFWIDKIKSKCYVTYSTQDEAEETRMALHDIKWPNSNPKNLFVDFATTEDFESAKSMGESAHLKAEPKPLMSIETRTKDERGGAGDTARRGASPAAKERRAEDRRRGDGDAATKHRDERKKSPEHVREWDRDKVRARNRRSRSKSAERSRDRKPQAKSSADKKEPVPAKLLDELFKKTKATPSIYWLPLTTEQIARKENDRRMRQLEREKRRALLDQQRSKGTEKKRSRSRGRN